MFYLQEVFLICYRSLARYAFFAINFRQTILLKEEQT